MSAPTIRIHQQLDLPRYGTYQAKCCRVWTLALGFRVGSCGYCGETPQHIETSPITEEMVDAAAVAILASRLLGAVAWDKLRPAEQEEFRDDARAALRAAEDLR